MNEVELQRQYYAKIGETYNLVYLAHVGRHILALNLLASYIKFYQICSVLDARVGTGRALLWLKQHLPNLVVKGIKPVMVVCQKDYEKGLTPDELIEGNA